MNSLALKAEREPRKKIRSDQYSCVMPCLVPSTASRWLPGPRGCAVPCRLVPLPACVKSESRLDQVHVHCATLRSTVPWAAGGESSRDCQLEGHRLMEARESSLESRLESVMLIAAHAASCWAPTTNRAAPRSSCRHRSLLFLSATHARAEFVRLWDEGDVYPPSSSLGWKTLWREHPLEGKGLQARSAKPCMGPCCQSFNVAVEILRGKLKEA